MPTSLFSSIFVTLTLHLVEGILKGSPTRDPPVTSEATSTRSEQRATKYRANFCDTRSECAVGCDAEGRVKYIVRDLTNSTYGFFLDVSMDAHLTRRFKGVGTGFSIEAQNATEKNLTDRVPSLKRHLMKEIGGIPPWEEEMLARMQGALNLAPYPSTLPFPRPSRSKLKYFSSYVSQNDLHWRGPSHGCEDMQLEFLYRYVSKRKAQFVQWVTWVNLDTPAPGQPLQITRLSTTLDRYIPEMELKFDEDRLRELEEGADQVVPDPSKLSDKPYMVEKCDQRFRNYVKYIAQKEGVPEADLMTDIDISQGVVMWLLTGKVHPRKPDNLDHWRGPYSTLHYKDHYRVPKYSWAEGQDIFHLANLLLEGPDLFETCC